MSVAVPCLSSSLRSSVQAGPRPFGSVRGLPRLEVRRSPAIWLLPLLAVVFWLDTYRSAMATFPLWDVRGAALVATAGWMLAAYAACVAVLFGVTASQHAGGDPAQQAVELGLLQAGGSDAGAAWQVALGVAAAAGRFAALPAASRHAWLATHLAALRAARITMEQLP
jgi:hypothetical protein